MPPEPLPWDRKDFKERKHERSESLGSVARWRDSSHHRDFNRWGPAEFRRTPGHGKQGGWHMFSEESGHGYAVSRSGDKMVEEDSRPSISRGDGKYGRSSRDSRGPFGQRDWRGHSWETTNGSPSIPRRPQDVNNDQRSVEDALAYPSHPNSDFVNTWDQHNFKDQHDKMGGGNGFGTGPRCDRSSSLGSVDWKPLKWTRSGSLSSRGSGFSHSTSSRSIAGADDSYEAKTDLQPRNVTAIETHSGEATACATSSVPSDDTTSRKKARLNWGEGLAKYEKKKVEVPDTGANKDGPVLSASSTEPCNFISPNLVEKSPKVTGFSDCTSPATPSSVACSSSPGVDDKLLGKTANVNNDVNNLTESPVSDFQSHLQKFYLSLDRLDPDSLNVLGSSILELVHSDDPSSEDSGLLRSNAINKLLIWKADISKVLEMTESEIDLLENELKSLKSDSVDRCPRSAALASQLAGSSLKYCEEHVEVSQKVIRPVPLKVDSFDEPNVEKMPLSTNLHSTRENVKEEDIDSPGTATSKFVEPPPLIKAFPSCNTGTYGNLPGELDVVQSTGIKCLVPCSTRKRASVSSFNDANTSMEAEDSLDVTFGAGVHSSYENTYNSIICSNKESANRAHGVFAKLLPKECSKVVNMEVSNDSFSPTSIMEKFAEKKRFAIFKERVMALKFKALRHLWREDLRLLSVRKCRPKSQKKNELSVRTTCNQKNRSSIRSRFPFPAGNHLSLVPTAEIINFTSKLLSESQVQLQRNTLKMPALILDENEKMVSKFISSNGLVEDPLAIEKERAVINPWTLEEREIFLEKYAAFGKDFRKIASFLDHKTTADCVEFYYKNHKSDCFEKLKKKDGGKLGKSFSAKSNFATSGNKWNREVNAASLEILSAASVMADGIAGNKRMRAASFLLGGYANVRAPRVEDRIIERSSSFDILGDERETAAAADVLAGICGSISSEAMSSCITSSVDPVEGNKDRKFLKANPLCKQPLMPDFSQNGDDETCSEESCGEMDPYEWTDDEKATFLQAVSSFGRDFKKLARCVGTRSPEQCKAFYSKARKCLGLDLVRPMLGGVGSPVNDDANGGESDTDDACLIETGSVADTDKSGNKSDEDLPSDVMNRYHDESNPVEARNLSAEFNESNEVNCTGGIQNVNVVSDACAVKVESKLGCDGDEVVFCSSEKSVSVSGQPALITSTSIEVGKDETNKLGYAVRESISDPGITEPCDCDSVAVGVEGERQTVTSSQCIDSRDDRHEADTVAVKLKSTVLDSRTASNVSFSSVGNCCSGLSFDTEKKQVSHGKPHVLTLSTKDPRATANSLLQNAAVAAVQCEKTVSQDRLSSTCDIQGGRDMQRHSSVSNGDRRLPIPGNHVETGSILQGYPLQMPIKKEVDGDTNCSGSAIQLPLLSQKFEQADAHFKTMHQSSDSKKTSGNGDVKLFGKILTNPSQKPNLAAKGSEENGTHHPKLSNKSSNLKFTGHHNSDGNLKILQFNHNNSDGYWDGNRIQTVPTGLSSLSDSSILLAKYPAAFSNYPTTSTKLEQQSLQAFGKNIERHLSGAPSSFTARDMNGSNALIDYQMFRSRDVPKVQPFMVDVKHCQDVLFSEMQRRNGFEAISSMHQQQQGRGMMGMNGVVGRPGILVGGSCSGVSDPVAAIKMHYSSSDKFGNHQNGSITRDDESWGGKADLGR